MQEEHIRPFMPHVVGSLICVVASTVMLLLGVEGHPPITQAPEFLLAISIVGFCVSTKGIYLSQHGICIHYYILGIKRRIRWERVRSVEFVCERNGTQRLFLPLDDCPSYSEARQCVSKYIFLHPIKLISILVPEKKTALYLEKIKKFYKNVETFET